MELKYYINETEINEPIGMESFKEVLKRTQYHGVVKSVSIEPLEFYGNAYDIITAAYSTDLDSVLRFSVEKKCSDSDVFIEEYAGMIDLSTYYVVTGDYCSVRCNVGDITDEEIKFNNRIETVVNIEQLTDMDGGVLSAYDNLNLDLTIPAKGIYKDAKVITTFSDADNINMNVGTGLTKGILVLFDEIKINELNVGVIGIDGDEKITIVDNTDAKSVFFNNVDHINGLKLYGVNNITVFWNGTHNGTVTITRILGYNKFSDATDYIIGAPDNYVVPKSTTFIVPFISTAGIDIPDDVEYLYFGYVITMSASANTAAITVTRPATNYLTVRQLELLDATTAKLSLIHETLSRTAEIISGMTVKSDYYAREDSDINPLNSGFGDGSLKSLVTGMKLRNGVQTDGTLPVLQSSFKDLFLNLNAIDNIGWGVETSFENIEFEYGVWSGSGELTAQIGYYEGIIEPKVNDILFSVGDSGDVSNQKIKITNVFAFRPTTGSPILYYDVTFSKLLPEFEPYSTIVLKRYYKYVRIEPFEYFYDTVNVALTINSPAEITRKIEIADIYTRLTVGYEKYADTEDVNSIDTFHTIRNYTTRLKATDKENKQVSKFVACPYAIEFTRRKALDKTTEDWKYDESIFILEMSHFDGYGYYVKQGMSNTNGTVISPETMYNVALSPARNAIRHIAMMFGFNHSGLNLYITGFTGNATAEGIRTVGAGDYLADSAEGASLTENEPLPKVESPLKAERIEFEYPITPAQWEALKLAPYKIITVDGEDTYIDEVTREVTTGLTKFKLIPKNV